MSDPKNSTVKTLLLSMLGGAIVVLVCWLLCDRGPDPRPTWPSEGAGPQTGAFSLLEREVKDWQLTCVTADFDKHYKAGPDTTNLAPLMSKSASILISSLEREIVELKKVGGPNYAMRVHHGLLKTGSDHTYDPAISLGVLDAQQVDEWDFTPIPGGKVFVITNGDLVSKDTADWDGWETYLAHMFVWRHTQVPYFRHVEQHEEVETYTFDLKHVEALIADNKLSKGAVYLKITSIAEPSNHDGAEMRSMRHHVCLLTTDASGVELIDRQFYTGDFTMKGLDVGSPCPPRCRKVFLPENGIPLRTSCQPS